MRPARAAAGRGPAFLCCLCRGLIEGECVDVDEFPAGCIFVSDDFSTAGTVSPIK